MKSIKLESADYNELALVLERIRSTQVEAQLRCEILAARRNQILIRLGLPIDQNAGFELNDDTHMVTVVTQPQSQPQPPPNPEK